MRKMDISAVCTISGMYECNMAVAGFVTHQNVHVLSQENGEWSLEIHPTLVAELVAALMNLEQLPSIYITDPINGVLSPS